MSLFQQICTPLVYMAESSTCWLEAGRLVAKDHLDQIAFGINNELISLETFQSI